MASALFAPLPIGIPQGIVQGAFGRRVEQTAPIIRLGTKRVDRRTENICHNDVLYLHKLRDQLDVMLEREGRKDLAQACFDFLPARAELDLTGWPEIDIFAHNS